MTTNNEEKHPSRYMTIVRGNRKSNHEFVPFLRLTGVWMKKAGFKPGDKIAIQVNTEELIIYKTNK